jgi:hypothetical protein
MYDTWLWLNFHGSPQSEEYPLYFRFICASADSFAIDHLNFHNRIEDARCKSCGALFTTAGVLARHMKNIHGPANVDSGPPNSGGAGAMTPENPLSHHYRRQSSAVEPRVVSEAIVTTSQSRRKKEARFACPIPSCIVTFTANHNLKSMRSVSVFLRIG